MKVVINRKTVASGALFSIHKHNKPYLLIRGKCIYISHGAISIMALNVKDWVEFLYQEGSFYVKPGTKETGFYCSLHSDTSKRYHRFTSKILSDFFYDHFGFDGGNSIVVPLKQSDKLKNPKRLIFMKPFEKKRGQLK